MKQNARQLHMLFPCGEMFGMSVWLLLFYIMLDSPPTRLNGVCLFPSSAAYGIVLCQAQHGRT